MTAEPRVHRITIYPIKALDGMSLEKAVIAEGGCLTHDREFAIKNAAGKSIKGKNSVQVHQLRSKVDFEAETMAFRLPNEDLWHVFHFEKELAQINRFLSDYFLLPVTLERNQRGRFLDIPDLSGITVLSTGSLEAVSSWFNQMDLEETRRRFRATIELSGVPAFWEDRLFFSEEEPVQFHIGEVRLLGMSPRARCVVPTRHPESAEVTPAFAKIFAKHRYQELPSGSRLGNYDHYYHLAVDCHIPASETGKEIKIGDLLVWSH